MIFFSFGYHYFLLKLLINECIDHELKLLGESDWKSDEKLLVFASLISPSKIILFEK